MSPELTIEPNYPLQALNTFGITAQAAAYVRITSTSQLQAALQDPALAGMPRTGEPVLVRDASVSDTEALLAEAGLERSAIEALRASGVIV